MSSFISTQFFVLNLDGLFDELSNKFVILDIPLLYYYTKLYSSIICCLYSGEMHLNLYILFTCCSTVDTFRIRMWEIFKHKLVKIKGKPTNLDQVMDIVKLHKFIF